MIDEPRDNLTPSNQGASKLHKGEIVFRFFLKTDQQLTQTVKPGMANLNHPTASLFEMVGQNILP